MKQVAQFKQPWLQSARADGIFILSPPFLALLAVACFPQVFQQTSAMPLMYWVILVVMIDVAHVYSTLYRTYFRTGGVSRQPMLIIIPLLCYVAGVLLYHAGSMIFWRVLAYLAVFHFIRQQYGFMRLYSRHEQQTGWMKQVDVVAIYTATIYPLLYWHFTPQRKFNWFVDGDFLSFQSVLLVQIFNWLYFAILFIYVAKELWFIRRSRQFNIPRNLIVVGTFVGWYFGIVYYNGDMAFTTLNVVSHGIPYMALIWIAERKRHNVQPEGSGFFIKAAFNRYTGVLFFVILLIALAYLEEGLWDGLVWREHLNFFQPFVGFTPINDELILSLLIPLLALPQSTHYVLDGFIWKTNKAAAGHGFKPLL